MGMILGLIISLIYLGIIVLMLASMWKIYTKAGKPGWACLIPIYNLVVLLEITKKPLWWIILLLIPFVNFVVLIIVYHSLSLVYGKDVGFTIGLLLLPVIFLPLLAFGDARYEDLIIVDSPELDQNLSL